MIQERGVASSDFGRVMNAAAAAIVRKVYPDSAIRYAQSDPPMTHVYTRILRDVEKGIYTSPSGSNDFLEQILPFLALYEIQGNGTALSSVDPQKVLADLERAESLNSSSVLPPLFRGFVYEQMNRTDLAESSYRRVLEISADCYPAELGLVRLLEARGRGDEALAGLADILLRYPDNLAVKKQLARVYALRRDWSRAEGLLTEILQINPRDGEFLLLWARILIDQELFQRAQGPLDTYASINSGDRQYLFFRARVQAEGYHNRDSAITYLRSIIRSHPNDTEASVYMAGLLLESNRAGEEQEGRALLGKLLGAANPSAELLALAVEDAIRGEDWRNARLRLDSLLSMRRENRDLLNAYRIERGLGNNAAALAYARELYGRDSNNDEAVAAYVIALIDTGRQAEAGRIIDGRLNAVSGGVVKSRYYYLRSRLRSNEEEILSDLRSSLFEDPRNIDALTGMFEIYHRRKDTRRAAYYLKQALSMSPNNPSLKRYEAEYKAALGASY
jgi:tetratricopeptide (TPR) repeat protein